MKAYELLYFVVPTVDDKAKKTAQERVESTIKSIKGKIDNVEDQGRKNLAYEINGVTDGDYMLVDFHCEPEGVAELNRVLRLTVEVQRHMIVNRTDRDCSPRKNSSMLPAGRIRMLYGQEIRKI